MCPADASLRTAPSPETAEDRAAERLRFDREHLWHPYASTLDPVPVFEASETRGTEIVLTDGRRLLDGISSWWCAAYGHRHPRLVAALERQARTMPHVMFGGLTHEPAVRLGEALLEMLPAGFHSIFYADSGSVAVEVAMKMAVQYQAALGKRTKSNFVTIRSGYHGDTWNAMSVCDPEEGMHGLFGSSLPVRFFIPHPKSRFPGSSLTEEPETETGTEFDASDLEPLAELLAERSDEIAALILEPVLQGAGGMRFYHPDFLKGAIELCHRHGVLVIFDEIATGFGRTGEWFAMNHAGVRPDIVTLGKALTGGLMTLSAVVTSKNVSDVISSGTPGAFMHGPTFMANPLACAVAAEALALARDLDAPTLARRIEGELRTGLAPLAKTDGVLDVRVLGAVGVVETAKPVDVRRATPRFVEAGVWLRPFGRWIYAMPPLVSTTEDVKRLTDAMVAVIPKLLREGDAAERDGRHFV